MPRLISSGSKSMLEVPSATFPRRLVMPVLKSMASTREVLPAPPWATTPRLRIIVVSYFPMSAPFITCGVDSLQDRQAATRPLPALKDENLNTRPRASQSACWLRR